MDLNLDDDSEDEEEVSSARPYMALLQSLTGDAGPQAKKRKLHHQPSTSSLEPHALEGETPAAPEGDVDLVEEAEDGPDAALAEEAEDDEDDEDASDPFESHFASPDNAVVAKQVKALQEARLQTERSIWQGLRTVTTYPQLGDHTPDLPDPISGLDDLKLKQKLKDSASRKIGPLDDEQQLLAPLIFNYRDILFDRRAVENAESLRKTVCLHVLNHIFK